MPLDISALTPKPGQGMTPRRATRTKGPNPFLDEGWLQASYDSGQDYEVGPLSGKVVEYEITKGEHKGETGEKLTGDAADAVTLIRQAAAKLGLGVAVEVVPATTARGKEIAGQYIVKYLAKNRKQYSRGENVES